MVPRFDENVVTDGRVSPFFLRGDGSELLAPEVGDVLVLLPLFWHSSVVMFLFFVNTVVVSDENASAFVYELVKHSVSLCTLPNHVVIPVDSSRHHLSRVLLSSHPDGLVLGFFVVEEYLSHYVWDALGDVLDVFAKEIVVVLYVADVLAAEGDDLYREIVDADVVAGTPNVRIIRIACVAMVIRFVPR